MNPLTNTRNISKLSDQELKFNDGKTSWHDEYKGSSWIFTGGLPYDLSEGDIIAIFSQYGEIVNLNLVRDKATGKSKGFAFVCYEDQRSTVLAVDNFNGIKVLGRTVRVDHVKDYKPPKDNEKLDDLTRKIMSEGCAPGSSVLEPEAKNSDEEDLQLLEYEYNKPKSPEPETTKSHKEHKKKSSSSKKSKKKSKKSKSDKKSKKKHKRRRSNSSSSNSSSEDSSSDSDDDDRSKRKRRH